jgi:hypothetical protein
LAVRAALALIPLVLAWPAQATLLTVTSDGCVPFEVYVPAPDVAYQAGVDVQGRPVVPADLPSGGLVIEDEDIQVGIEVPVIKAPDQEFNRRDIDATAWIGLVTIGPDGRALLDGRPIDTQEIYPPGCGSRP